MITRKEKIRVSTGHTSALFLGIKKLNKGPGHVLLAARHNKRELSEEFDLDPNTGVDAGMENYVLRGPSTATQVAKLARHRMLAAGVPPLRRDAVRALELVFSLPRHYRGNHHTFFEDCLSWTERRLGGASNVLSADVHLDEGAPHMHVLILPLRDGRMVGSEMMGHKPKLKMHNESFFNEVAVHHGLKKPMSRLNRTDKQNAAKAVFAHLKQSGDAVLKNPLWPVMQDAIDTDPRRALAILEIPFEQKQKRMKTMAQIFTSKGKGAARETGMSAQVLLEDKSYSRDCGLVTTLGSCGSSATMPA